MSHSTAAWYTVEFNSERVSLSASPPGRDAWIQEFRWDDVERVCFVAEEFGVSDGIYIFTRLRSESYAVPTEARGGQNFWAEIIQRGLFDAELAIKAATAETGVFCWPPDSAGGAGGR